MPYGNSKLTREGATLAQSAALIVGVPPLLAAALGKQPQITGVVLDAVETAKCRRSQSSEPVLAIIGGFLLGFSDSIFSAVLTLFATERTVVRLCSQTSGVCSH
jgi:phenylpyruvate tautomerase PptA (4-oxalocrotonate tautomerase family)